MAKLTDAQKHIAVEILETESLSISEDTSDDYIEAAAFVFDNGLLYPHRRQIAIDALRAALPKNVEG